MHTKTKGHLGELVVAQELIKKGWNVALPYGDLARYDLIAEKDGEFLRIQVKAVFPREGALRINCRSSNNWSVKHYSKADFEILAAVDLSSNKVFFVPAGEMRHRSINIRLVPAKNKQEKNINFTSKFEKLD